MLEDRIRNEDLGRLRQISDAAHFASQLLTADALRQEFDSGVIRRKSFCEAFDIGESTVSTWLQADRIPRVAAIAYVLSLAAKKMGSEIERLKELAAEPYVIRCGEGYAVVQPADRSTPDAIAQVIASGIETVELARKIAVGHSQSFRKAIDRALDALRTYEEQYDEEENWVANAIFDLERARDFKIGPMQTLDFIVQP